MKRLSPARSLLKEMLKGKPIRIRDLEYSLFTDQEVDYFIFLSLNQNRKPHEAEAFKIMPRIRHTRDLDLWPILEEGEPQNPESDIQFSDYDMEVMERVLQQFTPELSLSVAAGILEKIAAKGSK